MSKITLPVEKHVRINHETKTITITKAYKKATSYVNSKEYNALNKIRLDHVGYSIEVRKIDRKSNKFDIITADYIRCYIEIREGEQSDKLANFNAMIKNESFFEAKKWFLKEYPEVKQCESKKALRELLVA